MCCGSITHPLVSSMFIGFHIVDSTILQITITIIVNSRLQFFYCHCNPKKWIYLLNRRIEIMLERHLEWNVAIHCSQFTYMYRVIFIVFWIKYAIVCNTYIWNVTCPESMSRFKLFTDRTGIQWNWFKSVLHYCCNTSCWHIWNQNCNKNDRFNCKHLW